ncbi:cytochrome c peroxidase [Dyella japonica]|uniref:Cytochrome c peroxidase n=1 Tax=Dyella japonica TaxID=231455 RepID=A0ABV2JYI4_9GAMM
MSADNNIKCASCHIPSLAYTDGKQVAVGVGGRTGSRNTPSLSALDSMDTNASFFWDGRRRQLEEAVLDPMTNPVEMGLRDRGELLQRVQGNVEYRERFEHIFHRQNIEGEDIGIVLADYVRSLSAEPSAYDRYVTQGDRMALDTRAVLGLTLFAGKAGCSQCHLLSGKPAALTDEKFHRTGVGLDDIAPSLSMLTQEVVKSSLKGSAIGDRLATHPDEAQLGRFNVTREPADIGLFRTPSLRGVANTAPYMHDGSVPTLEDAIDREIYYRSLQAGEPLNLSAEERANLRAFLETL